MAHATQRQVSTDPGSTDQTTDPPIEPTLDATPDSSIDSPIDPILDPITDSMTDSMTDSIADSMTEPLDGDEAPPVTLAPRRQLLALRRLVAWGLEVSLLIGSVALPWAGGELVRRTSPNPPVPLNPAVAITQDAIARALGWPKQRLIHQVPPLTNLLWFSALGLPLVVAGSQLYWLSAAGKTWPKHWLGLQVITLEGLPPGFARVVRREVMGRWGLPLVAAYGIWVGSGAFPNPALLAGLAFLGLLTEGATAQLTRSRRSLHDALGGTRVVFIRGAVMPVKYRPTRFNRLASFSYPSFAGRDPEALTVAVEEGGLTSVILAPPGRLPGAAEHGFRQYPAVMIGGLVLGGISIVVAGLVSAQLYTQAQLTHRDTRQQSNDLFLSLVEALSVNAQTPAEQQAAVLALASTKDPRAIPFLVDSLAQTDNPQTLETLQQALITLGPETVPYLLRLNQTLTHDMAALPQEQRLAHQLRQQTVKRTLAKILALYEGKLDGLNLDRSHLGRVVEGPAAFTLVLENLNLAGIHWQGSVLSGASFRKSAFFHGGSDGRSDTYDDWVSDLSGSDLTEADFSHSHLRYVKFQGSSLLRANLSNSQAHFADFSQANLGSAQFIEANLSQANLAQASLVGADLTNALLPQATLTTARLNQVSGVGVNLEGADLSRAEVREANLNSASLRGAVLVKADFNGTRLREADLSYANLENANLQNTDLRSVNLTGANLVGANLQNALFFTVQPPALDSFIEPVPEVPTTGSLANVDFSQARNLNSEQLTYICAQGGIHGACPNRDP